MRKILLLSFLRLELQLRVTSDAEEVSGKSLGRLAKKRLLLLFFFFFSLLSSPSLLRRLLRKERKEKKHVHTFLSQTVSISLIKSLFLPSLGEFTPPRTHLIFGVTLFSSLSFFSLRIWERRKKRLSFSRKRLLPVCYDYGNLMKSVKSLVVR